LHCIIAGALFLVLYGITAVYFSGVMVRLMLVLAPAVCCLAGVAISDILTLVCTSLKASLDSHRTGLQSFTDTPTSTDLVDASPTPESKAAKSSRKSSGGKGGKADKDAGMKSALDLFGGPEEWHPLPAAVAGIGLVLMLMMMGAYTIHCVGVSADMYSAPSIVLQSQKPDGGVYVFDDFREAYAWLRHNTRSDTKVASW
jgi:dolichyl-diphosphooligosaccharide--protein glycosyltransferase